jgi:hypothetical protein
VPERGHQHRRSEGATDKHAARRAELEAKLASLETPTEVVAHPGAAEAYARLAERLHEVMEGSEGEVVRRSFASSSSAWSSSPFRGWAVSI